VPVAFKPGYTAQGTLAGTGRLVLGKVVVSGREKPIDWTQDVQLLTLKSSTPPEPVFPKPADFASENEFTAAVQRIVEQSKPFWTSEEGKALQRAQRTYVPLFNGDGSFRIEDVPPGTYTLKIALTEPSQNYSPFGQGTPIGALETEVTVPENSDDTPLDLGTLSLTPTGTPHEPAWCPIIHKKQFAVPSLIEVLRQFETFPPGQSRPNRQEKPHGMLRGRVGAI
jgi:hypothetical protein